MSNNILRSVGDNMEPESGPYCFPVSEIIVICEFNASYRAPEKIGALIHNHHCEVVWFVSDLVPGKLRC